MAPRALFASSAHSRGPTRLSGEERTMRILICTDGSPYAQEAVHFGARLAGALHGDTTLLVVSDSESGLTRTEDVLSQCRPILHEVGVAPDVLPRIGFP